MRKVIIFIFGLLFFGLMTAQTTEEEYNYLKKGYKAQIENGLDMKKGYHFQDYGDWGLQKGEESRSVAFKGLMRKGDKNPCAILVIYQKKSTGGKAYYCIPHRKSEDIIWEKWQAEINSLDATKSGEMMKCLIWGLTKFAAQLVDE